MANGPTRVTTPATVRPSLVDETRAIVRARIIEGAGVALAARGFDATADDIALAAGVSRRTVFRHFQSLDDAMAEAVAVVLDRYEQLLPPKPEPGVDLYQWLEELGEALHDANANLLGTAFWQMNEDRPGITARDRTARRRSLAKRGAAYGWQLAGGTGTPPAWVEEAFALQLSAFATNCLEGYSPKAAGRISARILAAVLESAVRSKATTGE